MFDAAIDDHAVAGAEFPGLAFGLEADVAADVIYTQQVMRYIREADTLKGTSTTAVKLDKETK